jgi:hypothetical protein
VKAYTQGTGDEAAFAQEIRAKLDVMLRYDALPVRSVPENAPDYLGVVDSIRESLGDDERTWGVMLAWLFTHPLGELVTEMDFAGQSRSWVDEWLLRKIIVGAFKDLGADEDTALREVLLVNALISRHRSLVDYSGKPKAAYRVVEAWLKDDDARGFLQVNRYQDVLWYNKEAFDRLLGLMLLAAIADAAAPPGGQKPDRDTVDLAEAISDYYDIARALKQAQAESGYRVDNLLAVAKGETPTPAAP